MNCLLCGSKNLTLAVPVRKMPLVDGYTKEPNEHDLHKCDLYRCDDCTHVQLVDFLPPELMFRDYIFKTGEHKHLVEHFKNYADWLMDTSFIDKSFVVEIGCNDGTLLNFLPGRKLGVDPSNVPCNHNVIREFITPDIARQIVKENGPATLVIANHVFAHTQDMHSMIESVSVMLSSRGVFVFEVAYLQDMLDKCLFDQIEHEHLSYHSITALLPFLNRHGMELVTYYRNECKGGSIRCVATRFDTGHFPYFAEDVSLERLKLFSDEIDKKRASITVDECVGYGASAPCTSVIYQMDLQDRIKYLVDDNESRHGLYSPNSNLPVYPSAVLNEDYLPIVILAPRYSKEIINRNQNHIGRFISL